MSIQPSSTVRDLAVSIPGATQVFEQHHIDYCCRGGHSLERACATAGVELQPLVAKLEQMAARSAEPSDGVRWETAQLSVLVEHIVSHHHEHTRTELDRLSGLANKVLAVHGPKHPEFADVQAGVEALADDLLPHMKKEEFVLFPYVQALDAACLARRPAPRAPFGAVANPVRMMMAEHEGTGELLRQLRAKTDGYTPPAGACATWRALYAGLQALERDLFQHMHLESNVLFPRAIELDER
jgi:regulator of cell morphogenesis and NO signaling